MTRLSARRKSSGYLYLNAMVVILSVLSVLAISGCGQANTGATNSLGDKGVWQLIWRGSPVVSSDALTPEQAFADYAQVQVDGKTSQPPAHVSWLMEGSDTALALVQLDTSGQHFALSLLAREANGQQWALNGSVNLARPAQQDADINNDDARALSFPATGYQSSEYHHLDSLRYSLWLWLSPSQTRQVFALARFQGHVAQSGAGTAPVMIAGVEGWQTTQNGVSAVVMPLSNDDTLVVAGLTIRSQVQSIASKAIPQLDTRFRI